MTNKNELLEELEQSLLLCKQIASKMTDCYDIDALRLKTIDEHLNDASQLVNYELYE